MIFKEVVYDGDGKAKGNCDADLVLKVTQEVYENSFDKAIIVSSDFALPGALPFPVPGTGKRERENRLNIGLYCQNLKMSNFSSIIKLSRPDLNSLETWSARRIRPAFAGRPAAGVKIWYSKIRY